MNYEIKTPKEKMRESQEYNELVNVSNEIFTNIIEKSTLQDSFDKHKKEVEKLVKTLKICRETNDTVLKNKKNLDSIKQDLEKISNNVETSYQNIQQKIKENVNILNTIETTASTNNEKLSIINQDLTLTNNIIKNNNRYIELFKNRVEKNYKKIIHELEDYKNHIDILIL
ncbi:hypothetical protein [Staphylococcus hominis]|uniref:hypothetical protein n=1 Tax=Staphylococcus hominis TaxID=1290 RepID=UPI00098B7CE1|nr:hypothetical protein [Staphylococcus hominis]TBW91653.1 hypothetical protein EQ808_08470 [Staphylococcus hominis]UNQ68297.1 hypothetical protein MOV58_01370 [Staphylococcus hominis]